MTAAAYGPLGPGNSFIGARCIACTVPFVARDWVAHVPIGPGGNPGNQAAARADNDYEPVTVPIHWPCHTGHSSPPPVRANASDARMWMQF